MNTLLLLVLLLQLLLLLLHILDKDALLKAALGTMRLRQQQQQQLDSLHAPFDLTNGFIAGRAPKLLLLILSQGPPRICMIFRVRGNTPVTKRVAAVAAVEGQ